MITLPPSGPLPGKEGAGADVSTLTGFAQWAAMSIIQAAAALMLSITPVTLLFAMGAKQPVEQNKGAAPAPQPESLSGRVTVRAILENPSLFTEKEIVLEGVFRGWTGKCVSPFITRSDWVLEDDTGCIYITGRIPSGLSPQQPKGERVIVKGRVLITKNGKPVIKASQIALRPN
jgi:hypothetical protein